MKEKKNDYEYVDPEPATAYHFISTNFFKDIKYFEKTNS